MGVKKICFIKEKHSSTGTLDVTLEESYILGKKRPKPCHPIMILHIQHGHDRGFVVSPGCFDTYGEVQVETPSRVYQ